MVVWLRASADEDLHDLRRRARALCAGWPHSSRSYRHPVAVVALSRAPVGVDVERAWPERALPGREFDGPDVDELPADEAAFARSIATPAERPDLPAVLRRSGGPRGLWSSKEALTKALGDPLGHDAARIDAPTGWPQGRAGRWRCLRVDAPTGHVAWLVWRTIPACCSPSSWPGSPAHAARSSLDLEVVSPPRSSAPPTERAQTGFREDLTTAAGSITHHTRPPRRCPDHSAGERP